MIWIDFETRSEADIKDTGAWVYSEHPSTEIICLCYAIDHEPVRHWTPWPGDVDPGHGNTTTFRPMPADLRAAILEGQHVECHNYSFEYSIWANICVARLGWPPIPAGQWRDSMATACYYALPASLDRLAAALGFQGKDADGSRLISRYSKLHLKTAKRTIPKDDLDKFIAYCAQDVLVEQAISDHLGDLPEREQDAFSLDLEMNTRGLLLDAEGIENALAILNQRKAELMDVFAQVTGGLRPTMTARFLEWLKGHGVELDNLQAETVEEALEDEQKPIGQGPARTALEIRRKIAKASADKLYAMKANMGADGRARFQVRYHGAQTGRWTGGGFQPLNLSRGFEDVEPEQLVRDIGKQDPAWLDLLYGDAMDAVAKATRHWIQAEPGHRIMAGDFVSIEAVVLACLAGEEWKIKAFRDKVGIYELMACKIYNMDPALADDVKGFKAKFKSERQDGKTCLGAGTRVLTGRGWIPITSVSWNDMIWDGVEWVKHEGLVYQGEKPVMDMMGVEITPDHQVLCGGGWMAAGDLSARHLNLALEIGSANLPLLATSGASLGDCWLSGSAAHAASVSIWSASTILGPGGPLGVMGAPRMQPAGGAKITSNMPTFAPTMRTAEGCSTGSPLALRDANPGGTRTTASEASESLSRGRAAWTGAERSSPILSRFRAGIGQSWRLIALTLTGGMSRATSSSSQGPRTQAISVLSRTCSAASPTSKPVYDLMNAGPRRRFTILTDRGPVIVHNCELAFGYGGGLQAWLNFDSSGRHSDERIHEIKRQWRKEHPAIAAPRPWKDGQPPPGLWVSLEDAALEAVRLGPGYTRGYRELGFEVDADMGLSMILPDGKRIWYHQPGIIVGMPNWHTPNEEGTDCYEGTCGCKPGPKLRYKAQKAGQWKWVYTYGGKLTENACQAVSRQILVPAKVRLRKYGYPIILSVYDEVVCEVPSGHGNAAEFEELLTIPAGDWCANWPIRSDVWVGSRYKKG